MSNIFVDTIFNFWLKLSGPGNQYDKLWDKKELSIRRGSKGWECKSSVEYLPRVFWGSGFNL